MIMPEGVFDIANLIQFACNFSDVHCRQGKKYARFNNVIENRKKKFSN